MAENRIAKIDELIRQELGKILIKEVEFPLGTIVTITRVKTDGDVRHAIIYMAVYPDGHRGSALKIVTKKASRLQHLLNRTLAMQHVPRLRFVLDTGESVFSAEEEVEEIFRKLQKES